MFPSDAPCHGRTDDMFPGYRGITNERLEEMEQAAIRTYCRFCPYQGPCEDAYQEAYELQGAPPEGVWAGKTTRERRNET